MLICLFQVLVSLYSQCAEYWINPDAQHPSKKEYIKENNINTIYTITINLTGGVMIVKYLTSYISIIQ